MTRSELISAFRSMADDTVSPYLWSDSEIEMYLNEAEREAATRANLLTDESSSTYSQITLVAAASTYALNPLVIELRRVTLDDTILARKSKVSLDDEWPGWETEPGPPTRYVHEGQNIRLVPIPDDSGTLMLDVVRLPVPMESGGPEIHSRYHIKMLDWALYLAYSKRDADTYSLSSVSTYMSRFDQSFGESQTANVQRQNLQQRVPTVSSWI